MPNLAVWPIGDQNVASSRYRIFDLVPLLERNGIRCQLIPGGVTSPATALQGLYIASKNDGLFIQKKIFPARYFSLLRWVAGPILFDFDDALYTHRSIPSTKHFLLADRARLGFQQILAAASLVIAGNDELANYAREYARRVIVIPSMVDAKAFPKKVHSERKQITVGWIGGGSGHVYLDQIREVFEALINTFGDRIKFRIITGDPYRLEGLESFFEIVPWSRAQEHDLVLSLDIGIMPLTDDDWSRGKCGFKALQMMGYGIPVVISPIGMNKKIVKDGWNGFLADSAEEWIQKVTALILSCGLREEMGMRGRDMVLKEYSVEKGASALAEGIYSVFSESQRGTSERERK